VERKINAIGIAFPGPTDFATGVALDASNFGVRNFRVRDEVRNTFEIETFVDNDVNLGVWGEHWKGAAHGYQNVVGIMIGTGIGGGIIVNDRIYRGRNKTAGEMGHMIVNHDSDIQCGCLQYGCFESLASRKSMARELHKRKLARGIDSRMWAEETLLSNEIAWYYKNGDADAFAVVHQAAEVCGKAVFSILNLFNPEIIVFNGGFVQQLGDEFLLPVREEAKKCMNAVYSLADKEIPIVMGQLPNPVLFGACRMAIEGMGGAVEISRRHIIETIVDELDADDWTLLDELYWYGGPVPINRHPEGPYHRDRLRTLRNCGLLRTRNGVSFRNADSIEITALGRIAVEEASRSS
jgi:glucokinase